MPLTYLPVGRMFADFAVRLPLLTNTVKGIFTIQVFFVKLRKLLTHSEHARTYTGLLFCLHRQNVSPQLLLFFLNANVFLRRLNRLNSNSLRSLQCFDSTNNVKAQLSLPCHLMSAPLCDSSANRAALCAAKKKSQGCGSY